MLDWNKKEKPIQGLLGMGGGIGSRSLAGASSPLIDATGGTKTTPGDGYIYHQFTSSGSFVVNNAGSGPDAIMNVCVVGGGGGGGRDTGGGGGAGGFRDTTVDMSVGGPGTYSITVGSGGAGAPQAGPGGYPTNPGTPQLGNPGNPSAFAPGSSISVTVGGGGGGGGGTAPYFVTDGLGNGRPGTPFPYPTASPPHPNAVVFPGSGGGAKRKSNASTVVGPGAGGPFNSYPGKLGTGSSGIGGGGGGAGSGGPPSSTSRNGGAGKQLPWALPTWGWGENNDSGLSGSAPSSPSPDRPAGPSGELPWGYGWFCGGGGGGAKPGGTAGSATAGGGAGSIKTDPNDKGAPSANPNSGTEGIGNFAAFNTGSGGGGSGEPEARTAGSGGPGAVMIRYKA